MSNEDREFAACNGCEKTYPATVSAEGDIVPIGVGECRDCGGTEFTLLEEEGSQAFAAED